ncbi:adenylate kinase [bacterium]|nr:adenylate kinase [bacterium]
MKRRLIILGAPGVGKGTQAKMLAEKYNWMHVSTGDMLREAIKSKSDLGKRVKNLVNGGNLVPDTLIGELIEERLNHTDCQHGFLLDGFPRTLSQGEMLDTVLQHLKTHLDDVIYLHVDKEEIVRRLSSRGICDKCGQIVTVATPEQCCNKCGITLHRRKDDEPETVRYRLSVYVKNTEPLIKFYENKGLLRRIDGTGTINEVFQRIEIIINQRVEIL